MANYALFFSYTHEAWTDMIKNPSDRSAAAGQLVESLGGKLEASYWMFSDHDGFAVVELPDSITAEAVSVAVPS
ncbi:MAG: GYD domain-containing protein [Acidimicrobiia bacterium]|nr:GYD domain-containing protein [Acidimicrobiia bacterium]